MARIEIIKGKQLARAMGYMLIEYTAGANCTESYYKISTASGDVLEVFYASPKKNHKEARNRFREYVDC